MSFKEKSTWISLISTLAIFGNYFYRVFELQGVPLEISKVAIVGLMINTVVLIIIVEALFHSMLAATNYKAAKMGADERDKLIEYRGNSIGYSVLVVGVLATLIRMIATEYNPEIASNEHSFGIPMLTAHILMLTFILSEVARFSGQIFYYRRGY
ncbi:hypothetical protein [Aliiglaciecola sp. LCG003]|uniref:hypothetical protein n=1 Tax=Aliiglaciecola sp. LCG003 TaxID=3053655 RepID=UPI0025743D9F|nr:hypothetical protein [Aliiglaciecola sp. LCG003]WJG09229.1 hypothetical protein QR722_18160 [Aliiglaciecola sp. LCG003]